MRTSFMIVRPGGVRSSSVHTIAAKSAVFGVTNTSLGTGSAFAEWAAQRTGRRRTRRDHDGAGDGVCRFAGDEKFVVPRVLAERTTQSEYGCPQGQRTASDTCAEHSARRERYAAAIAERGPQWSRPKKEPANGRAEIEVTAEEPTLSYMERFRQFYLRVKVLVVPDVAHELAVFGPDRKEHALDHGAFAGVADAEHASNVGRYA